MNSMSMFSLISVSAKNSVTGLSSAGRLQVLISEKIDDERLDVKMRRCWLWPLRKQKQSGKKMPLVGNGCRQCLPDLIVEIGREGRVRQILAGTPVMLVKDRRLTECLPAELADIYCRAIDEVLGSGEMQVFEYLCPGASGPCYRETRLVAYGQDAVLAVIRDVTEYRRDQMRAEEKQKQMNSALERIQHRSFLTSLAGRDCA